MNAPSFQAHPLPEELHPSLWRASQLARAHTRCIDTGYPTLSRQLSGGGWPMGCLVDLLVQQAGIRELQLLAPALKQVQQKGVMLLQPPQTPHILGFANLGLAPENLTWLKSKTTADSQWAAEQILRAGCAGALLFWSTHVRPESARRLHLAAQASDTLFIMVRPLAAAQDASPAPLRIGVRPAAGGVELLFHKRRGPQRDDPLFLALDLPGSVIRRMAPEHVTAENERVTELGRRTGVIVPG